MAETTRKILTHDINRKDLSRHHETDKVVYTGTGIQGGLSDSELDLSNQEEWSKEFDR
tara:strand:+ start:93 stop:266 length:174 start_codon:yes stop_codon:yes gene_type:complete